MSIREHLTETSLDLSRGKYVIGVDWSKVSDEMIAQCAMHGLRQKIQDSYASAKDANMSRADIIATAETVRDAVYAGQWATRVAMHPVIRAFVDKCRKTAMAAIEKYDAKNKEHLRKVQAFVDAQMTEKRELLDAQVKQFDDLASLIDLP